MSYRTGFAQAITLIALLVGSIALSACGDDFLTRLPQDEISDEDFFDGANDLRLYVNQFYELFPGYPTHGGGKFWDDNNSDNMAAQRADSRLNGLYTVNTGGGIWISRYNRIRRVNYMLAKTEVDDLGEQARGYIGEARFFRAYFYFELVRNYGDVPWISKPLDTESEELFHPRTPRSEVVDSMLDDLDYAIAHLPPKSQAADNRLNLESALLFKSRVALFEGTWQKYHQQTPFGVEGADGQRYLEIAAEAAKELIDMGTASIFSTGDPDWDYRSLFGQDDLSDNPEVLLWRRYDVSQGQFHNLQRWLPRLGGRTGLTKALVDAYLADDGDPIAVSSRYEGDETLEEVVANRDPRLAQTIWVPGDIAQIHPADGSVTIFEKAHIDQSGISQNTTGYQLKKGSARGDNPGIHSGNSSTTAYILFRYAEALLNYAEARAELGEITQADLDITVNQLRDRVDMPPLMLGNITSDPNWDYPSLSPIINEIRRERRVEFAVEGYRFDDILRWAAADKLITGVSPLGARFNQDRFPDLTVGEDIHVNHEGYIRPFQLSGGWGFDPNRDYLLAVPPNQITLNEQLEQNPGW